MQFPHYSQYVEVLAQRDTGVLMVSIVILAALVWLINTRFAWPRLLPYVRVGAVALFYLSLVALVFMEGFK